MDIILIRHAEAGDRDAALYPNDDLRPITPEGRKKQTTIARAMKKMGVAFDHLFTSPLDRAVQTAEIVAEVYGAGAPVTSDALGHGCTTQAVLKLLARVPSDGSVALVGHEPDLSRLAAAFISKSGDAAITLKKSGVIGIGFEGAPEAGTGALLYHLKPGLLRKLKA